MKNLLIFFLVMLVNAISCKTYSNSAIDSLRNELQVAEQDTLIAKLLLDIGYAFERQQQADSAIYYYNKSNSFASEENLKPQQAIALRYLGIIYRSQGDSDKALNYYHESLAIGKELNDPKVIAAAYNSIGLMYYNQGIFETALEYFLMVIELEDVLSKPLLAIIYNNIGICFDNLGLFDKAIENHINSLKIREELGDKSGIAASFTNIGGIHHNQQSHDNALEYYSNALKLYLEINDKRGLAISYNNIGLVYRNKGESKKSIEYHLKSIEIREMLGDRRGLFISYNNIGSVYRQLEQYDKALGYYEKAMEISTELGDKHRMSIIFNSTSNLYIHMARASSGVEKQNYLEIAKELSHKAFDLAIETGSLTRKSFASNILRIVYTMLGKHQDALKYAEIYIATNDSVYTQDKLQAVADAEKKFQSEKKQLQIEKLENEKALQEVQILRQEERGRLQHTIILIVAISLLIISVFLGLVIHRLNITRKQKRLIEEQKILVEEKNIMLYEQNEEIRAQNEEIQHQRDEIAAQRDMVLKQKDHIERQKNHITNSIAYAKLIQTAVLPSDMLAGNILGEHFILFFPKDIVSGDFYWLSKIDDKLIFAVADCTGHGVPGAFMSMLGLSFLKEIVGKQEKTNPAEILNILRDSIIDALQQKGKPTDQREGLDIALCVLDTKNNNLQYAGANSPLIIVNKNKEAIIINADKQPIAFHRKMKPFTNKNIQLNEGDKVYLASDGYQNQLGGANYKMFMSKNFHKLLSDISDEPMPDQGDILYEKFLQWKEPHEQVDDVTVVGLNIH